MTRSAPRSPSSKLAFFFGFCIAAGLAGTVLAGESARTYSTKGKVVSVQRGHLLLKDKFGVEWEYDMPQGFSATVGNEVKVTYTMNATKIEVSAP